MSMGFEKDIDSYENDVLMNEIEAELNKFGLDITVNDVTCKKKLKELFSHIKE